MSQSPATDFPIDPTTTSGDALADILNRQNDAINTTNAGPTPPPRTMPGQLWLDTSVAASPNGILRLRDAANTGWTTPSPDRLIKVSAIKASQLFLPDAQTNAMLVRGQGAGGGGGGATATVVGQASAGAGGGAGGIGETWITGDFSAGIPVTVGDGGPGGIGPNAGMAGGLSSFGTFLQLNGGFGGAAFASTAIAGELGGDGGPASLGNVLNSFGAPGFPAVASVSTGVVMSGMGASGPLGAGGQPVIRGTGGGGGANGNGARGYGAGGSGALSVAGAGQTTGGAGGPGIFLVYEYAIS